MKEALKSLGQRVGKFMMNWLRDDILNALEDNPSPQSQLVLYHMYRELASRDNVALPSFKDVGFRCNSQFEEDGILLYIFALIETTNKVCVEICAGNGIQCNTSNLILNHGWWGYLFDGNEENVSRGIAYYQSSKDTFLHPPSFRHEWITAENVNTVIRNSGVPEEIDLLSLDIDGMDYWVWKVIDCIKPRVVVVETLNVAPPDESVVVPYDADFKITTPDYFGASLAAMAKLAKEKGYRLVGTHRFGFNAFFVLNGIAEDLLPEVEPGMCLNDPYSLSAQKERWPKIKDLNWIKV